MHELRMDNSKLRRFPVLMHPAPSLGGLAALARAPPAHAAAPYTARGGAYAWRNCGSRSHAAAVAPSSGRVLSKST
eukprot:COSAG01_NODE_9980_length_2285_cov_1.393870_1_plen_75_part_10